MITENKELLLRDLSARLSYGVILRQYSCTKDYYHNSGETIDIPLNELIHPIFERGFLTIRPYLRPMSSMTEEEKEELKSKCIHTETEEDWEGVRCDSWGIQILDKYDTRRWDNPIWPSSINMDAIDWLNKHHFDYRGLIEKGLALEAPEGMYEY